MKEIKENDVFHFRYPPQGQQGFDSRTHCFEGLLVARKDKEGGLFLQDTYWGLTDNGGKSFLLNEAQKQGTLTFYCNLDEIEVIPPYDRKYYDDADIFVLHSQNACVPSCKYYYKRKGAGRSKSQMLETVNKQIKDAKRKAQSLIEDVSRFSEIKAKIEGGDLTVYLYN